MELDTKSSVKEPLKEACKDAGEMANHISKDLDHGWSWMVLLASFGVFCSIGGATLSAGITHSTLLERFHESVSSTAWAGALQNSLLSAGGPLSSALIDRYSCRVAIVSSGTLLVLGYIGAAFAPNLGVAIFTCGLVAGIGCALGYTASMVVIGFNFDRKSNLAYGIAVSGVGVGMCAMAPIMQLAREYYGNSGFFIIVAAMCANNITFGVMCFPSKLELSTKAKRKREAKINENEKSCPSLSNYGNVLCNKSVICLCLSMFLYCFGSFLMFLHLPEYIILKGFSAAEASYVISITGILNVIGRILTGAFANLRIVDDIALYSGPMAVMSLASFLFPLYSGYWAGQVVFAVVQGFFMGSCYVVMTAVNIRFVGIHYMSAATGLEFFFGGIGALIGPIIAGIIIESGGTYDQSIIVAATFLLLAAIVSAVVVCFPTEDAVSGKGKHANYEETFTTTSHKDRNFIFIESAANCSLR